MKLTSRWIIIILVVAISGFLVTPLSQKISLGLDLKGGMHLLLSVDTQAALNASRYNNVQSIRSDFQSKNIAYRSVRADEKDNTSIHITYSEGQGDLIKSFVSREYDNVLLLSSENKDLNRLEYTLDSGYKSTIENSSVKVAMQIISNRVDQYGVAEPVILQQGFDEIVVELPGISNQDAAIDLIGQTATLTFREVDTSVSAESLEAGIVPPDSIIMYVKGDSTETNKSKFPKIAVSKQPLLTGTNIVDAQVSVDSIGQPSVTIRFDSVGTGIFADYTSRSVGKYLAIALDDIVSSYPVINSTIATGNAQISGSFTAVEANNLAIVLRSGSLPAPVRIEQQQSVGASLGAQSIRSGLAAIIIGLILVLGFMIIYYGIAGIIANVALVLNLLLVLAGLSLLDASLSLPGIAGIILTVGMSVDSNVLIFERIREELKRKNPFSKSIRIGYERAFLTIFDANFTTLIAAVVLFQFGTGSVKGFAITLSLGIISSMFTAIFVTRTIMIVLLKYNIMKKV